MNIDTQLGVTSIKTAVSGDFEYVLGQSYKFRKRFNFVPARCLRDLIDARQVFVARLNGQPAGYILTTAGLTRPLVVRHNCVEQELWQRGLGHAWMSAAVAHAQALALSVGKPHKVMVTRTRADRKDQIVVNAATGGTLVGCDQAGASGHVVTIWHHQLGRLTPIVYHDSCRSGYVALIRSLKGSHTGANHTLGSGPTPAHTQRAARLAAQIYADQGKLAPEGERNLDVTA